MSEESNEAPHVADESHEESVAPDAIGTSEEQPFDINDVPEEYRQHVADIERQFKGQYTRKTQELAEARKTYEESKDQLDWIESLRNDPEVQLQLLRELAEHHGYDFEELDEDEHEDDEPDVPVSHDPRLDDILAEREAQREQEEWDQYVDAQVAHADSEFDRLGKRDGYDLPEELRESITEIALGMQVDEQGRLPIDAAYARYRALEKSWQDRYIASKSAPQVHSGAAGSQKFDATDKESRLARARAIVDGQAS